MGDKSKSIAEQINWGGSYSDSSSNGPGMVNYLKSLFNSDGAQGSSTPQKVPKKKKAPPQPVYKARGGSVKKKK